MKKKYFTDAERRAANRAGVKRYQQTEKGKASQKRYKQSQKGRIMGRAAEKRYRQSVEYKAIKKQYAQSKKGRAVSKKAGRKFLLKQYDMTLDDYDRMFAEQKGRCAICKTHQSKFGTALAVDHNRKNKKVRGLLCINCNTDLQVLENKVFCKKANMYLEIHRAE